MTFCYICRRNFTRLKAVFGINDPFLGPDDPVLGPKMGKNAFLHQLRPRNASRIVKTIYDLDFNINCGNSITLSHNGIHIVGAHGPEKPHFGPQNGPKCLFTPITAKKQT